MACGTPVVAFGATGLLDIIEHKHNGYLAQPYQPADLAAGIAWVLSRNCDEYQILSKNARGKAVSHFSIEQMSTRYISLFEDLVRK